MHRTSGCRGNMWYDVRETANSSRETTLQSACCRCFDSEEGVDCSRRGVDFRHSKYHGCGYNKDLRILYSALRLLCGSNFYFHRIAAKVTETRSTTSRRYLSSFVALVLGHGSAGCARLTINDKPLGNRYLYLASTRFIEDSPRWRVSHVDVLLLLRFNRFNVTTCLLLTYLLLSCCAAVQTLISSIWSRINTACEQPWLCIPSKTYFFRTRPQVQPASASSFHLPPVPSSIYVSNPHEASSSQLFPSSSISTSSLRTSRRPPTPQLMPSELPHRCNRLPVHQVPTQLSANPASSEGESHSFALQLEMPLDCYNW